MRGGERDADDGQDHAEELQPADAGPEQREVHDHDEDVHRHLLDGDVHAGGVVGGHIDEDVERRKADGAEIEQQRPGLADHRPVALERSDGEGEHRQQRAAPAQDHQRIGLDMADREFAGHHVATPEERRQRQDDVGSANGGNAGCGRGQICH